MSCVRACVLPGIGITVIILSLSVLPLFAGRVYEITGSGLHKCLFDELLHNVMGRVSVFFI